jgi:hypothetical protein
MEFPEVVTGSKASLVDVPAVIDACEWLEDNNEFGPSNIHDIIKLCLRHVKKLKTASSINAVTKLTAVAEYVKLQDRYRSNSKSSRPCLNASLAIARHMGKVKVNRKYFSCQIHQLEVYLLAHGRLPPSKVYTRHSQYALLDNEAVFHGVCCYLTAQNLGSITPYLLCHHVNEVIIPALELTEKETTISE